MGVRKRKMLNITVLAIASNGYYVIVCFFYIALTGEIH